MFTDSEKDEEEIEFFEVKSSRIYKRKVFTLFFYLKRHRGGILSSDRSKIYFIGIIDILTKYK